MYLSSIQQGIQAAHSQMELFNKYVPITDEDSIPDELFSMLFDWSLNHKTMICLNGGFLEEMEELYEFIDNINNPYPYSNFHEEKGALGGILTNIAIILPERIYIAASLLRSKKIEFEKIGNKYDLKLNTMFILAHQKEECLEFIYNNNQYTEFEIELITRLTKFKLAI